MTEDVLRKRGPLQQVVNSNGNVPNIDEKTTKVLSHETEFIRRESALTRLLENSPSVQAITNIYLVIQLLIVLDSIIYDYIALGRINLGVTFLTQGIGDYRRAIKLWLVEFGLTLSFYAGLRLYDYGAKHIKSKSMYGVWKFFGIVGVIVIQCLLIGVPSYDIFTKYLAVGSATAVACEMFRFAMKIHAVCVSCGPRCRVGTAPLPSFLHYLYFLFAPTLVYRDKYPKTILTRWDKVVPNFAKAVFSLIFIDGFLWQRFVYPMWSDYGKESTVEAGEIVRKIFVCIIPGIISYVTTFYCILHCWLNAFADIMSFGDRLFYEEWWTASRFSWFYRAWNRVVHSWLREYIYMPLAPRLGRVLSISIVFFISSVVHEVIIALAFRFFFPVMWIEFFVLGLLMIPLTATSGKRFPGLGNFTMWLGLFVGNGLLWSLYPMEYFARQNCPPSEDDSFFVPKCFSCPKIVFNNSTSYIY